MKTIYDYEYNPRMGILIDVRKEDKYLLSHHHPNSININFDKLMMNYNKLLDKNKRYFIICENGNKSKQAVRILAFYGYDVTYVINS